MWPSRGLLTFAAIWKDASPSARFLLLLAFVGVVGGLSSLAILGPGGQPVAPHHRTADEEASVRQACAIAARVAVASRAEKEQVHAFVRQVYFENVDKGIDAGNAWSFLLKAFFDRAALDLLLDECEHGFLSPPRPR